MQTRSVQELSGVCSASFLPSVADINAVKANLTILVARILVKHISALSFLSRVVPQHIHHKYSKEMASKSDVVLLDVLMENEASHAGMLSICRTMHNYLGNEYKAECSVLAGGDQLTRERMACAQRHVMDADTPEGRLSHLVPVTEDWHCMVIMLQVNIPKAVFTCLM